MTACSDLINAFVRACLTGVSQVDSIPAPGTVLYYVYAISSLQRNYIYVGISNNPERRIMQHNKGYERTTKPYRPYKVLIIETYPDRPAAREREKYLKTTTGKRFLKKVREQSEDSEPSQ